MFKIIKPGTNKFLWVTDKEFKDYEKFGWERAEEIKSTLKPAKKTAQTKPAVDYTMSVVADIVDSVEEVGTEDIKGE